MMRWVWVLSLVWAAAVAWASPAVADEAATVRAVMFWDEACPNCEDVLKNVLPEIEARYGQRFDLVLAEVSALRANDAYFAAIDHFQLPQERQGVPLLVIGDQVLLGRVEIADRLAPEIERGLANGGVDLLPALELTPDDVLALEAYSRGILATEGAASPSAETANPTDALAHWLAIAVLVFMLAALTYVAALVWRSRGTLSAPAAAGSAHGVSRWVPVLAVAGGLVAGYLTYVKFTGSDTVCPIGRCEAVQHSAYASLLGVPVSLLGLLTYVAILILWWWGRRSQGRAVTLLLAGVSVFGTAFSAYLTFLEPFVIQAVCMWCLVSAVLITVIMVLAVRAAVATAGAGAGDLAPAPA